MSDPHPPRPSTHEENLARRIRFERDRRGLSTYDLARRVTSAGVPATGSSIWKMEQRGQRIRVNDLMALAEALKVDPMDLLKPPEEVEAEQVTQLVEKSEALAADLAVLEEELLATLEKLREHAGDGQAWMYLGPRLARSRRVGTDGRLADWIADAFRDINHDEEGEDGQHPETP